LNRERTPGGSSSGSAAAIAAGMAPLALATQTNGSTIRPASFCGIVGYKPSLGLLPRAGILRQSALLDQPGIMATDVADAALLAEALAWHDPDDEASSAAAPPHLVDAVVNGDGAPRLAYVRGPYWQRADADARLALDAFVEALAGIVTPIELPPAFDRAADVHRTIMEADIGQALRADYERGRDQMSDVVRGIIERGLASSAVAYAEAVAERRRLIAEFVRVLGGFDALVTLAATGSAPLASAGTGDPILSTTWTLIGAPAISLPLLWGADGMPIGIQLVARPGGDERLLAAAGWLEARHRSHAEMVA
jgi:Asp-tRNA(Asn)/Glu-tRNA(Gln) amidotransferase A subunit family amidase